MSSEEKDRESGKPSTAVAPPAPLVAEISQNTNNEDQDEGGPTNEQADLMEFFQNLAQEMSPLQQPPPPPPPPEELAAAAESQKQQQKQQQHGHRSRGRRQGIKRSYISTDDHLDTLIGGDISSAAAAAAATVEPTDNNINDGPMMMMIQEHPGPQKPSSSITSTPVHRTLANIEEQMVTIRNKLDKRSPKVTTAQLNQKLDRIINILRKNGISE